MPDAEREQESTRFLGPHLQYYGAQEKVQFLITIRTTEHRPNTFKVHVGRTEARGCGSVHAALSTGSPARDNAAGVAALVGGDARVHAARQGAGHARRIVVRLLQGSRRIAQRPLLSG